MHLTTPGRIELDIIWGDTVLDCLSDEGTGQGGVSAAIDRLLESEWLRSLPVKPTFDAERIEAGEVLRFHHRDLVFRLRAVKALTLPVPSVLERLDYGWLNSLTLAIFAHLLMVSTLLMYESPDDLGYGRLQRHPVVSFGFQVQPKPPVNARLGDERVPAGSSAKDDRVEGARGGPKLVGRGRATGRDRVDDRQTVAAALRGLIGVETENAKTVLGTGVLGTELENALGGVKGAEVGAVEGALGLGTRGEGPGAGGLEMYAAGLGALGTHGRGPRGEGYDIGPGGRMLGKSDRDLNVVVGSPVIVGALDKDLIRRVIEENKAQIRYCYERELVRHPGLFGKIAMIWTIRSDGSVDDVRAEQDTLGHDTVQRCVMAKIRTWQFPKPNGGGIVVVNYPFVFKAAG